MSAGQINFDWFSPSGTVSVLHLRVIEEDFGRKVFFSKIGAVLLLQVFFSYF